ncbi:hypothetical protein KUA49_006640 [Segatella copri]|uniref:hypothetical protein n=1 Tax=Segatella copri TaxID=165179 RepID=UPI001C48E2C8|nr:hypothetical protein [Segatella copri]WOZ86047.1 hypothetical protein KUA49_006640 [Segatella copri]
MKASKLNDEESAEKLMEEFGEEVEEKLRLGLSKEDLFFIHNEYFEVNPIFKYYEKVLRCANVAKSGYISIDAVSMSEDDCSEVAFYFIMKFIDKILGMIPKGEKNSDSIVFCMRKVPLQLCNLYEEIWGKDESDKYDKNSILCKNRILAATETIYIVLSYVYFTENFSCAVFDSLSYNPYFPNEYGLTGDDFRFIVAVGDLDCSQQNTEIKNYMRKTYNRLSPKKRISKIIDDHKMSGRNARINHSNIYIKDGKKTGIVVVLEGMAKAGWLVDHRGDKITNIGDSVELILEKLFNDKNPKNEAQLLSHAKNVGLADITHFIDEIKRSFPGS